MSNKPVRASIIKTLRVRIAMEPIEPKHDPLLVIPLGFDVAIVDRLKSIFLSPRDSERRYRVADTTSKEPIAVLLVNYDNANALQEKTRLLNSDHPYASVIAVSQGPLADAPPYHIRGMLTAARVLTLLDKIPIRLPKPVATPPIAPPVKPPTEPIAPPVKPVAAPVVSSTDNVAAFTGSRKGYCALVVDDSVAIQKSLELKLATLQQITRIDFADSGEVALEKAESKQYDLIFLDVMMPGIDGYETCTRLRKKPEYKKTPIIMVSGKSSPLDEVKGVIAGCTTYLIKPVQDDAFHKLSVRVLAWLSERSSG